ncbi:MAG: glycerol-3-phosphate 1-O-acyltransferase [Euzebya sp.]
MHSRPTVILADVSTTPERALVTRWARDNVADGHVVTLADLSGSDLSDPATVVLPVRVTWLPKLRASGNRLSAGELLLLARPRRPWAPLQQVLTRIRPDAAQLTDAEPASVADLTARYHQRYGTDTDNNFAAFVGRQALVALDRAERVTLGQRYKVPRLIAEQILDKPSFSEGLQSIATKAGTGLEQITAQAKAALEELIAVQSPVAIELWRSILKPMHSRAWDVDANPAELSKLSALNRTNGLIFLPSHRSYVDPLILADVLLEHDLPRNHTLGGANLSFWPFGPLGKRSGIVFIRRSFGGDDVYKFAVRHYLAHLMAKRFNVEWFMEGGRTRTGKLRRPKYGILTYLVDGLTIEPQADPILVPVSLVYEQLHEVSAMAAEELGGDKQDEGLAWLARYLLAQREHLGQVKVRFGEPLPLRQALADAGEGPLQLEKVAFTVASRINAVTPATATSLITLVLLGERDRALTPEQITDRVRPLLDYLDAKGIERPRDDLRDEAGVNATLERLAGADVVEVYDDGKTPVWSICTDRHHTAAFYRNGALHHLLNRAIAEMVLVHVASLPEGKDHLEAAWDEALRLRDLLKFEFFFSDKTAFRAELEVEAGLLAPEWEGRNLGAGQASRLLQRVLTGDDSTNAPLITGPLVAKHVLRSFLDAQLVAAEVLADLDTNASVTAAELIDACVPLGQQMARQRRIHGVESVSRELFGGCASLAENRDLLAGDPAAAHARETYRAELRHTLDRLDSMSGLAALVGVEVS